MKRIILVVTVLLVAFSVYGIYLASQVINDVIPNAYAADWSAAMIIEYLETHENQWPKSWDDLRVPYETLAAPQNHPWSFDELRQRIDIDWAVDMEKLKTAAMTKGSPAIKVIWLTDGSDTHWQGEEPNQRIIDFLRTNGPQP